MHAFTLISISLFVSIIGYLQGNLEQLFIDYELKTDMTQFFFK